MSLRDAQRDFAGILFDMYAGFLPTRGLYLDLEGSGNGWEEAISLYWACNLSPERFSWAIRPQLGQLGMDDVEQMQEELALKHGEPQWVVVFSGGKANPDERCRVVALLGEDPFPDAVWINLHHVLTSSKKMTASIRDHRYVWYSGEQRTRYSLEALEREFDIKRPPTIRSHSNEYSDGKVGQMRVLESIARSRTSEATDSEVQSLERYCRQDVESMFKIARKCELGFFSRRDRRRRWRTG